MSGTDFLKTIGAGLEVSLITIVAALIGYKMGDSLEDLGRMLGLMIGAFGGFAFGIRNVLRASTPAEGERG